MEYLYHYTSLDSLALILKNKTIRLNNLSDMDDLEEGSTNDFGKYGRFTFISSWTDEHKESIPLWALYTQNMTGVRIKLRRDPFDIEILKKNIKHGINVLEDLEYTKGLLMTQNNRNNNVTFTTYKAVLEKVKYTDDENLLYPKIVELTEDGGINLMTSKVGICKSTAWDFQKEWRYIIRSFPLSIQEMKELVAQGKREYMVDAIKDSNTPTIKYIDLFLKEDFFKEMEILCGPKMSVAQKLIVQDLIEKYNPTASLNYSNLKIK